MLKLVGGTGVTAPPMRAAIVIPARFASSRFPGKPLVSLRGAGGAAKSLIQRSWEAACAVGGVSEVLPVDRRKIRERRLPVPFRQIAAQVSDGLPR